MSWREADHPRAPDGEFTRGGGMPGREWAGALADDIGVKRGDILGPQGPYTSLPVWRSFPAGSDDLDAREQVLGSEEVFGGLGKWYGPQKMAEFYASNDGSVVVGVRFRPDDLDQAVDPDNASGITAPRGTKVAVVAMKVSVRGVWHVLDVPPNLVTYTTEP